MTTFLLVPFKTNLTFKDPTELQQLEEWDVFRTVHDKLFITESGSGDFSGVLAQSWVYNEKTKSLRIKLKENLKFSDGRDLNAEDVIFSIKRKIRLTFETNPIVPLCLGVDKATALKLPETSLRAVKKTGDLEIEINLGNCDQSILEELAGTNFSIVDRYSLDEKMLLKPNAPTSGAFSASVDKGEFVLKPNHQNWRYSKFQSKPNLSVHFTPISDWANLVKAGKPFPEASFLRTDDADLARVLVEKGYKVRYSLPTTSVFLSLLPADPKLISPVESQTIHFLNYNLDRTQLIGALKTNIYIPSEELFPKDMNCSPVEKKAEKKSSFVPSRIEIILTSLGDSPFAGLKTETEKSLSRLGFKVISIKENEISMKPRKENTVAIQLRGQHLSLRPLEVMNLMVGQLKAVPDPQGEMMKTIAAAMSAEKKPDTARSIYQIFHQRNFVPIAHRRNAFLAANQRLLDVYSVSTGNLHIENLISIIGDKK